MAAYFGAQAGESLNDAMRRYYAVAASANLQDVLATKDWFLLGTDDLNVYFAAAPLLRATFTATDGTALTSYTPEVGGPWTDHNSVLHLTGNALTVTATGQGVGTVQTSRANVQLTGTVSLSSLANAANAALVTRFVDALNYWCAMAELNTGAWSIYEVVAGGFTQRATTAKVFATGTAYSLVLIDNGATLAGTVDGGSAISFATASNNTTTRKGVRLFNATVADIVRLDTLTIVGY